MDKYRHELQKMQAAARGESFELEGGGRFYLDPEPTFTQERLRHVFECVQADYERKMRPEPHRYYRALCEAKNRRAALNKYFLPEWTPDAPRAPLFPYNVWVLVEEGRLVDQPFAEDGFDEDENEWVECSPIPYDPEVHV